MATATFDTLKFVERLKAGGVPEEQAKAEAEALVSALSEAMDLQFRKRGRYPFLPFNQRVGSRKEQ